MKKQLKSMTISEEFSYRIEKERKISKIISLAPLIIFALMVLIFSTLISGFATLTNMLGIFRQLASPLVIAIGLTFIIVMGGIDLSVEGIMALTGSIVSLLILNDKNNNNLGIMAVVIALLTGALMGGVSGVIHVKLKLPTFLVTFAMSSIAEGFALLSYGAIPAIVKDQTFLDVSKVSFIGIPVLTWIALAVLAIAFILQKYTSFGRYVFAIGYNESIPKMSGIKIDRVKIMAFVWAGLCFGLAGVIGASRLGKGDVLLGKDTLFPAITAVVVGGTSLSGGKGGVLNTLIGALIVTVLNNALIMIGLNPFLTDAVQGIIIIAAVVFTINRSNKEIVK